MPKCLKNIANLMKQKSILHLSQFYVFKYIQHIMKKMFKKLATDIFLY